MKRRNFVFRIMAGGTLITALPVFLQSCEEEDDDTQDNGNQNSDLTIDLNDPKYTKLQNVGESLIIDDIIIANTGNGNFVALSSICTHQGCVVDYNDATNNFPCPCHGSVFSVTGSVLNGPAVMPLKEYSVNQMGDILTIS